jgi:hypothetical protein
MYHVRLMGSEETISLHEHTENGLRTAIAEAAMRAEHVKKHHDVFNDEDGMVMHVVCVVGSDAVFESYNRQKETKARRFDRLVSFVLSAALVALIIRLLFIR